MKISDDEARALAFIAALIVLTALGRWVDRPRAELPAGAEVDLAALTAQSETALAKAAGGQRGRKGAAAPAPARKPLPGDPWVLPSAGGGDAGGRNGGGVPPGQPLDINRASVDELVRLPGVGPSLAARIVARRDTAGPFRTLEQLDSVRGIGPALLARLKPLLRLAS